MKLSIPFVDWHKCFFQNINVLCFGYIFFFTKFIFVYLFAFWYKLLKFECGCLLVNIFCRQLLYVTKWPSPWRASPIFRCFRHCTRNCIICCMADSSVQIFCTFGELMSENIFCKKKICICDYNRLISSQMYLKVAEYINKF